MRTSSTMAAGLIGMTVAASAFGQVSIGPNGIRSGNTVIDAGGVHANGTEITSRGVHTGGGYGTVIRTNGGHRTVDCAGSALTVDGNANHLSVRNCASIFLNGNSNEVTASFARDGRLALMGNHNTVRWSAPKPVQVAISNPGSRNSVIRE